jgi:hypothetical protein
MPGFLIIFLIILAVGILAVFWLRKSITTTLKTRAWGKLKKFLLLTGASAVGFFISALLHNIVGALFDIEEPVFFVMATIVCPIGFLVGVVGTIVLSIKNKPPKDSGQNI